MRRYTDIKLFATAFVATALALYLLMEFHVIERVSYEMEKGRLRAMRETLPSPERLAELSRAGRVVPELVRLAVVSIETESDPSVDLAWLEHYLGRPSEELIEPNRDRFPTENDDRQEDTLDPEAPDPIQQSLDSGFIFDAEHDYVLTNAHVVEYAKTVQVYLTDGRETEARVLGADPESDLAVLRIDLPRLHSLSFADAGGERVGDEVFAVGNPFGLDGTVTKGIISAINRRNVRVGSSVYGSLLQTDAVLSPGNSGGPLVNLRGEVIGISTAIATSNGRYDGVGFAIPSAKALEIIDDLIEGGPGVLGVWVGAVSHPDWRSNATALGWKNDYGALVTDVIPGMAGDLAGLEPDDIVLSIDDTRIDTNSTLADLVAHTPPGTQVRMKLWHDGQRLTLPVRIGRRYDPR